MNAKKNPGSKRAVVSDLLAYDAPLSETAAALALAVPLAVPSPRVKEQLLARIRATPPGTAAGWRFATVASGEGWVALPFPGVRMREVTVDMERDTALVFIEIAPGAAFPDHEHQTTERGLLLSGDLRMGERMLRPGDFYEAAAGTRHDRIASPSGCTGLLWVGAAAWRDWRAAMAAAGAR
ncbi:MAG: cupin domain-containing protein [Opitutaceae bacterium]